jgi:hypothetical protein
MTQTINGLYAMWAPELPRRKECRGPLKMELAMSTTGSHVWGYFDFGEVIHGWLRSSSSIKVMDGTIEFQWRGRDTSTGETSFGKNNVAKFMFSKGSRIMGSIFW